VMIRDACPAYIAWEQYQSNRRRIAENQVRGLAAAAIGPVREGPALLGGLLRCGKCGRRMTVRYDDQRRPRYTCTRGTWDYGQPSCQSLAGRPLEALVRQQMLTVLSPATLELSLQAAQDIQQERATLDRHWRLRLERAGYDADHAARQYHAVDPENRLVARELESQWEQKLVARRTLEEEYDRFSRQRPPQLSAVEQDQVRVLTRDIPTLWDSPHTTAADRQTIIRHLVEQITVHAPADSDHADLTIRWAGGFVSQHRLRRPVARYQQLDDFDQLLARLLELRDQKHTSRQIAHQLNREGFHPPKRRATFNAQVVRALISRHRPSTHRPRAMTTDSLREHEWWFADLARHLQLPQPTLYSWLRRGWVRGRQLPIAGGRWVLWADHDELDRLRRLHRCPKTWHNQPQAADLTRPKDPGSI